MICSSALLWLAILNSIIANPISQNSDSSEPLPDGVSFDAISSVAADDLILSEGSTGPTDFGCTPDTSDDNLNMNVLRRDARSCPSGFIPKKPPQIQVPSTSGKSPDSATHQNHGDNGGHECPNEEQSQLLTCGGPEIWSPEGVFLHWVLNCVKGGKSEVPARAGGWQWTKHVAHYCCKDLLDIPPPYLGIFCDKITTGVAMQRITPAEYRKFLAAPSEPDDFQ